LDYAVVNDLLASSNIDPGRFCYDYMGQTSTRLCC
jgi:hypothetical protein